MQDVIVALEAGTRLIVKESDISIPKKLRKLMLDILHYTHWGDEAMLRQCKKDLLARDEERLKTEV